MSGCSPHGVVGGVRVAGRDHADHRADLGVLAQLDVVGGGVEERRLVDVLHAHVHDGHVLEGRALGGVRLAVGPLHLQRVAGLALEVQRLEEVEVRGTERGGGGGGGGDEGGGGGKGRRRWL